MLNMGKYKTKEHFKYRIKEKTQRDYQVSNVTKMRYQKKFTDAISCDFVGFLP